jgi:hypothetical protein
MTIEIYTATANASDTMFAPNANGTFNWLDINGVYTYASTYGECMVGWNTSATSFGGYAGTNNARTVPTVLLEGNYEGEDLTGDGSSRLTYRKQQWWAGFSGCLGFIFGNTYTWSFKNGWQSNVSTNGAADAVVWKNWMNSIAWWTLQPDQAHVIGTEMTGGWSPNVKNVGLSYSNDNYVTVAADSLTSGVRLACAYFPQGSTATTLTVDLSRFGGSGTVTAKWVDPTTGGARTIGTFSNTGTRDFTPRGKNAQGDPDWVLLFTA